MVFRAKGSVKHWSPKTIRTLLGATGVACGILGLVLLRWTPTTGKGILLYAALFLVLIVMAMVLSARNRGGYWPRNPD